MNDEQLYTVVGDRGSMTVFEIYIKTSPERLWEAITDGEMRKRYSFGVGTESAWTEGSEYRSGVPGVVDIASGENVEVDPPPRLVQTFTALWSEDVKAEGTSQVTWEIDPVGDDSCRLRVIHDHLGAAAGPPRRSRRWRCRPRRGRRSGTRNPRSTRTRCRPRSCSACASRRR